MRTPALRHFSREESPASSTSVTFFMLTAGTRRGEMDRFFTPDYTNATITVYYKEYDNETIRRKAGKAFGSA